MAGAGPLRGVLAAHCRALVVTAAEQHACWLVVPNGQLMPATSWTSHNGPGGPGGREAGRPAVSASLKKLEPVIERADRDRYRAERQAQEQPNVDEPDESYRSRRSLPAPQNALHGLV